MPLLFTVYITACVGSLLSFASLYAAFLVLTFFTEECVYTVYFSEQKNIL